MNKFLIGVSVIVVIIALMYGGAGIADQIMQY